MCAMSDRKYVLDTSLFVNPHARGKFGKNPRAAVRAFIKFADKLSLNAYMPPSVFNELRNFVDAATMDELELAIKKRAPNTHGIFLPAAVFYEFIEDIRARMNKGMRLAEEFAQDNRPENEVKLRKLREKYRDAVRSGIIDSKEDLELVLLAKELDGVVVTSDEGAIKFANKIGCEWLGGDKFHGLLKKMKK